MVVDMEIQSYLDKVFEFEKDVKTCESVMKDDQLHIYILSPKVAQLIGRKGWILKLLADVINAKYSVYPNIHVKDMQEKLESLEKRHDIQVGSSKYKIEGCQNG